MNDTVLSPRQTQVLDGIRQQKMLQEIGADLGLSRQRISQIVAELTTMGLVTEPRRARYLTTDEPHAYRKLPVEISAARFTTDDSATRIIEWAAEFDVRVELQFDLPNPIITGLTIPTLEGPMTASPGDWVVKGVANEFYPVKPAIFAETYEVVADD